MIEDLLRAVVESNYEEVTKLLDSNIHLLEETVDITDPAGRFFKRITAYQYALWALDVKMVQLIDEKVYLLPEEESNALVEVIWTQRQALQKTTGAQYAIDEQIYREVHYNEKPLSKVQAKLEELEKLKNTYTQHAILEDFFTAWFSLGTLQEFFPEHILQMKFTKDNSGQETITLAEMIEEDIKLRNMNYYF
jgi:hypothetical protein